MKERKKEKKRKRKAGKRCHIIPKCSFRFQKCAALRKVSSNFGQTFYFQFLLISVNISFLFSPSSEPNYDACKIFPIVSQSQTLAFHDNCKWPFGLKKNQQTIILCEDKKLCRVRFWASCISWLFAVVFVWPKEMQNFKMCYFWLFSDILAVFGIALNLLKSRNIVCL